MKNMAILAAAAMLGACTTVEPASGPSGQNAYAISCPAGNLNVCFSKARELCPKGYAVASMRRPDTAIVVPVFVIQDQVNVACS